LLKTVTPTDGDLGMRFGASVALSGSQLAVGAPYKTNGTANNAGSVYYYSNYNQAVSRAIAGNVDGGNLGQTVALASSGLLIGCPFCAARAGTVFYHSMTDLAANATPTFKLFNLNQGTNDGFGNSVAVSGNNIIVGSSIKSDPNNNSGASYIYIMK